MAELKSYTRICVDCGKVLHDVGKSTKRCPDCAHKRDRMLSREWNRKRAEIKAQTKREQDTESSRLSLHDAVRAAESAGLSYGKYMLLKMQANKKPAGAPTPTSCKG